MLSNREKIYEGHQYITTKETRLRKVGDKVVVNYRELSIVGFTMENGKFAETSTTLFRENSRML